METFLHDIRCSVRALVKSPGFTLIAVFVIALGIGASTAIFSAVNAILLRPMPYREADRIVVPVFTNASRNIERGSVAFADYMDWKQEENLFEAVAVFQPQSVTLTGAGEPVKVDAALATEEYFAVSAAPPLIGRTFDARDGQGNASTLVMSYRLWQQQYGADPDIVGKSITANGRPYTVIGVMPADSQWPADFDLWALVVPESIPEDVRLRRDNQIWRAVARLKPGVTVEQANATLRTLARRVEEQHPESRSGWSAGVIPLDEYIVGPQLRRSLLVLFAAVGFVLLIACANIANLLLVRAAGREREMAIRTALGAGRFRLVRLLMTESLLLALVGGSLGLLLALWLKDLIRAFGPGDIPRIDEITIDAGVLVFAGVATVFAAMLFGLMPAFQASKASLTESLKEGGRGATSGRRAARLRSALVISEIAMSVVLLASAGLMIRSFIRLQNVDPGFAVENLLTFKLDLPRARYSSPEQTADGFERIAERVRALPGVESVGSTSALPVGTGGFYLGRVFLAEGQPEPPAGPDYQGNWNVITPDYFATMSIPVLRGRSFGDQDRADSAPVIIINDVLARQMFPGEDPIGKRIRSWRDENMLREIVGVVRDVRYFGLDDESRGLVYVPHRQNSWRSMVLAVRASGDPAALTSGVRSEIGAIDKDLPVYDVRTMESAIHESVSRERFTMMLLAAFAFVAMALAAIGVYGILSYGVARRTHEIGVRMALGAQPGAVLRMVVGQGLKLALGGISIGMIAALAVTRVLESLLYGTSATDPLTFAAILLLLTAVALLASYIPARRATKVDPMIALRYE